MNTRLLLFGRHGRLVVGALVACTLAPLAGLAALTLAGAADADNNAVVSVQALRSAFIGVAAVSALLALVCGVLYLRATLGAVHRLLAGTQRIGTAHDFTTQVPVHGRDEFALLSASFNGMVSRLGQHIGMLKALSRLDRAILTSLDIREVAQSSLRCLHMISGADIVSVGLLEIDAPNTLRVYTFRNDGATRDTPEYAEIAWAEEDRQALAKGTAAQWSDEPALPSSYANILRQHGGGDSIWVQGIVRADRLWGVVVLAHAEPQPLRKDSQMLALGIADRLAVALSSAARDRQLHQQAHYDALTGLPNRHYLLDLLTQELARARREQYHMSVLFLDLDRFKQTNDTLGHTVGDALLKQAAERIKQSVREVDIVARLGGDEFTIVLTRVESVRDVGLVAQQLIKVLSKAFEIDGQKLYVGASVGIAMYPEDADGGSDLLKKADTAMYRAKELGRGRFAFFEERMNADLKRRATLDRELRSALENGEFVLRFQPQIDLSNGQLCCAEALIRWQHPVHGLLGPIDFIPIAEDCGLIDTIGAWVLKEACAQMVRWRTEGVPIPRVSVNVSNRQLRRADFVRAVDYILVSTGLPPDCLEIEVTESLFLEGGKAAVDTLRSLENAGVVVAIDDFGTGYSSFSYLRTLPASVLKLDKSFIADVVTDKDAGTIAAAIVNMAHTLRKQVVAEGVETEEQLAFLRQLGCEKVQGFLFSRPLPALRIAEFARKRQAEVGAPLPSPEEFDAEAGQETVVGKLLAA